jgi:energy-coupling factor transport system substrate-specific component
MSTTNKPTTGSTSTPPSGRGGSILASRPLMAWRTVDLLTVAFLGAAFGIAYWGWGYAYQAPSTALSAVFPPLAGIVGAPWLMAGVVGGLVIRRPGAALLCEVIAALVEMLPGTNWGFTALVSGILQGLGAELGFLLLSYASFGIGAAMLAGALAAPLEAVYEWFVYWTDWGWGYKIAYAVILTVSGAVIAGAGGWLLTKALAKAGALNAFPPGQEERELSPV